MHRRGVLPRAFGLFSCAQSRTPAAALRQERGSYIRTHTGMRCGKALRRSRAFKLRLSYLSGRPAASCDELIERYSGAFERRQSRHRRFGRAPVQSIPAVGDTGSVVRSALPFKESEALRVAAVSPLVFGYETDGVTLPPGKGRDSLHVSIREQAMAYFKDEGIGWWRYKPADGGEPAGPTRLMRSSQVACINHLMLARLDRQLALAVVRSVMPNAVDVELIDGGFVAFEWIGEKADIGETGARMRGANRTNLDAVLIARLPNGKRVGLVIEWTHTESYTAASHAVSAAGTDRVGRYRNGCSTPPGRSTPGSSLTSGTSFTTRFCSSLAKLCSLGGWSRTTTFSTTGCTYTSSLPPIDSS
jgi:hypothetical protein